MKLSAYPYYAARKMKLAATHLRKSRIGERLHRLTGGIFRTMTRPDAAEPTMRERIDASGKEVLKLATGAEDREYWVALLSRTVSPVLENLAAGTLRRKMPVECESGSSAERRQYSHLEAFGRVLAGIAPWLELDGATVPETDTGPRFAELARRALHSATDPASPDFLNFSTGSQPLVDAAYVAQEILRAPRALWTELPPATQQGVIAALRATRGIRPVENNWLLFSAMIEVVLRKLDGEWEPERVDHALMRHEQWYKGDGAYGDGPHFRWDYYNSFVIHPMLVDVLNAVSGVNTGWDGMRGKVFERAVRYAEIQERMISPEGTFPALGRSIAYRTGAFHLLAQMALQKHLPVSVNPAQVRCALTAVMRRMFGAPGTFDDGGWLRIGFCGHQPKLGEHYVSTGSLYACALVFLPLGLPRHDDFWRSPPEDWSSRKIWQGRNLEADKALPI